VPIAYGLPGGDMLDLAARGEIEIGGCVVGPQLWACRACGYRWPLPPEALAHEVVSRAFFLLPGEVDGDRAIEVAHLLFAAGYEPYVVAAGLLHEALASGGFTAGELADEIGAPAASLLEAVTVRDDIEDSERRRLELRARVARAGDRAAALYTAIRLCELRALLGGAERGTARFTTELRNAERDVRMLARCAPPPPFLVELQEEVAVALAPC